MEPGRKVKQIDRGAAVTGAPQSLWVSFCSVPASVVSGPVASPRGELHAGVPHYTLFSAALGSWPIGQQPSEEMASFLFLSVRKARLTSIRGVEEWGWAEEWEEVAQSWPELQTVTYRWHMRAGHPTSSKQN